jgi:hypothetical protein
VIYVPFQPPPLRGRRRRRSAWHRWSIAVQDVQGCAHEASPHLSHSRLRLASSILILLPCTYSETIKHHAEEAQRQEGEISASVRPAGDSERRIIGRGHAYDDETFHADTPFAHSLFADLIISDVSTFRSLCVGASNSSGRPRCRVCDCERAGRRRSDICRRRQPLDHSPEHFATNQRNFWYQSSRRPDSTISFCLSLSLVIVVNAPYADSSTSSRLVESTQGHRSCISPVRSRVRRERTRWDAGTGPKGGDRRICGGSESR